MLSLACALVLVLVTFGLTGLCCLNVCNTRFSRPGDGFFVASWIGAGVTGLLLMGLSVFTPLKWNSGIAVATLLCVASLAAGRTRAEVRRLASTCDRRTVLAFGVMLLSSALYMSQPVSLYDTGLYHYGAIRWLARFGAVRGLALLHHRFGFASTWFALSAPFDQGFFEGRMVVVLNAFVFLLTLLMGVFVVCRHIRGEDQASDVFFLGASSLVAATAHFFHPIGVSASPNYPIILLTVAIAWAMLVGIEGGVMSSEESVDAGWGSRFVPTLMAAGALGVKVLSLPLLLVSLLQYSIGGPRLVFQRVAISGAIVALLALPIAASGWVVSGCFLFPASWSCIGTPWAFSPARAAEIAQSVRDWSRWMAPTPVTATSWNWVGPWLREGVAAKSASIGALAVGLTVLGVSVAASRRRARGRFWWLGPLSVLALVAFWCAGSRGLVALAALLAAAGGIRRLSRPGPARRSLLMLGFGLVPARVGVVLAASGVFLLAWLLLSRALNILTLSVPCLALFMPGRPFVGRRWLLGLGLVGITFNLFAAPGVWYGLGYIAVIFGAWAAGHRVALARYLSPAALGLRHLKGSMLPATLQLGASALVLLAIVPLERQVPWPFLRFAHREVNLWAPSALPLARVQPARVRDVVYYRPVLTDQCWAAPLPCTPEEVCGLALRKPVVGLRAGFVVLSDVHSAGPDCPSPRHED